MNYKCPTCGSSLPDCGTGTALPPCFNCYMRNALQILEQPDAIEAAIKAENEACANVAARIGDKYAFGYYGNEVDTADEIAAAIRARVK